MKNKKKALLLGIISALSITNYKYKNNLKNERNNNTYDNIYDNSSNIELNLYNPLTDYVLVNEDTLLYNKENEIISTIDKGTKVSVIGSKGNMYLITLENGVTGYINKLFVNKVDNKVSNDKLSKPLDKKVYTFLNENRGKYVQIPKELRNQLGLKMDGYVQIPENIDLDREIPLIVNLPGDKFGASAEGNGLTACFIKSMTSGKYRTNAAIIYTPFGWATVEHYDEKNYVLRYKSELLQHDIEIVADKFNINKEAISLMGYSNGGFAALGLTKANPNYYSAAAICGADLNGFNITVDDIEKSKNSTTYIWFIGSSDVSMGVNVNSLKEYNEMKKRGINTIYYSIKGAGHGATCSTYSTDELINDLARIRKGEKYKLPKDIIEVEYKEFEASSIDGDRKPANYYIMLSKSYNDNVTLKHK